MAQERKIGQCRMCVVVDFDGVAVSGIKEMELEFSEDAKDFFIYHLREFMTFCEEVRAVDNSAGLSGFLCLGEYVLDVVGKGGHREWSPDPHLKEDIEECLQEELERSVDCE